MLRRTSYNARIFDAATLDEAQRIILTPENGRTTHERWNRETPYLASLIAEQLNVTDSSLVLDYGCGVGRIAKEVIAQYGCRVIGVDTSANMRSLAEGYVDSRRFLACSPQALDLFGDAGFDAAVAIWVLQHCPQVDQDLARLKRSLKADAPLFIVNENRRLIPTDHGWISDGLDIDRILQSEFNLGAHG